MRLENTVNSTESTHDKYFFLNSLITTLPIQHLRQIFRLQVGIAPEHLQRLVPCDGRNLHGIQPLLEESAGGFVAEIMECDTCE